MMQFSSTLSMASVYALSFAFFTASLAKAQLQISAVVDGPLSGGLPKAVELIACSDISNLSIYGLESANNGGGVSGADFTFPSESVSAGDYIYVATESAQFQSFFGFVPNFLDNAANINGDDAIVLYKNDAIIDVFGETNVDGTGQPWEYQDGWATRMNEKAASVTFNLNDWTFSGPNALDGETTNASSAKPVPIKMSTCGDSDGADPDSEVTAPEPSTMSTIMDVQGSGLTSPMVGQTVTIKGIVTYKIGSRNVCIQDVNGDGDDATSDAILVYGTSSDSSSVSVGDLVEVTGEVTEYIPGGARTGNQPTTEIVNPTYTVTATGQALPAPVEIGAGKRLPPTSSLAESIVFWESMESMIVKVLDPIAVAGTTRFGETFVRTGGQVTSVSERGTLNIGPADYNPERIQIDGDGVAVDVGAILGDVVGVVSYNFGEYEIVGAWEVKTPSTLAPTVTSFRNSGPSVLIGSYNVLNLEVVDDLSTGRFALIAQHIVTNMGAPDIVGLQEIQDNDGATGTTSTVTSASVTLQTIIDEINKISSSSDYKFIDNTLIGDDTNGGQPGGNIRTAFLYNAKRVSYDEASLNAVVDPVDQQTNESNPFYNSRLPLAATFSFMGQTIEVVNVHLASKGGSAPTTSSDAQPFEFRQSDADVNGGVDQRFVMSQAIREYVSGKDNVVVLGDFNEFEFNLPLVNLLDTPLTNLAFTVAAGERYSYIFNGNSQALDHIFVSPALDDLAKLEYIHVNCEFADVTERASDHDPLVASIRIDAVILDAPNAAFVNPFGGKQVSTANAVNTVRGSLFDVAAVAAAGLNNAGLTAVLDPVSDVDNFAANTSFDVVTETFNKLFTGFVNTFRGGTPAN